MRNRRKTTQKGKHKRQTKKLRQAKSLKKIMKGLVRNEVKASIKATREEKAEKERFLPWRGNEPRGYHDAYRNPCDDPYAWPLDAC
jgi:hypothetical protein